MTSIPNNAFKTLEKQVHIWVVNLKNSEKDVPFFRSLLSEEELNKALAFRYKKDETCAIITRGVLRFLSEKYLSIPSNKLQFKYGAYGKPEYNLNSRLKFNVSHAANYAVLGFVNNYDFGIDVEYVKRNFDVLDIADNYFSKQEKRALHKIPENQQTEAFFRGWTRKEAFIKAKSQGLSFPLDAFSISIDSDENATLYETAWNKSEKNLWRIVPFETHIDYKAAFAVKGKIDGIKYFEFDLRCIANI
ncbi:4'-phosphopantetheinyl transferase [Hyunsoonleella jejuensis]|uniref:4'-phosphopantetheinyl transferase n=1 Tax=Hyunsoonleella jejuensis TaxID=419940 RepID=A0A1H9KKD3_9FLAO|nr:4'-phosphopantetheinyl transferase superfamily protein [Hyunsoonleella jejuensis]SEQ99377.1 4'-phosphopantetheinyl transferase [Hyunsoonleella jejuensis]